jgi:phage baseplate assembly protein W
MATPKYRGLSFPFRRSNGQFPAIKTDDDLISDSIRQLMSTGKGERIFHKDIGIQALKYVFENNNAITSDSLRFEVINILTRYEPRIIPQDVQVIREDSKITLLIRYIVRATRRTSQTVIGMPIT